MTYNVKGLNSPLKRHKVLKELEHLKADVVFLQETRLPSWFYGDSPIKRAKGVAIGFSKRIKFKILERSTDQEGHYLFLKVKVGDRIFTLANIYCPNKNPVKYLSQVLTKLMDFRAGEVILAGDLNFCLDPTLDSTSGLQGVSRNLLIKK